MLKRLIHLTKCYRHELRNSANFGVNKIRKCSNWASSMDLTLAIAIWSIIPLNNTALYDRRVYRKYDSLFEYKHDDTRTVCLSTYAWYVVVAAHPFGQQPIPDLPREDGRTLTLVVGNLVYHTVGGYPRLRATNGTWLDRTGFIVPIQQTNTYSASLRVELL